MAISFIASATGTNSVTVPGTAAAGDLLLIIAYRDGAVTPTNPTGAVSLLGSNANTSGIQISYVNDWNGTTTTYSNGATSTRMAVLVYRGARIIVGGTQAASATGTTNTTNYPALNSPFVSGASWVVRTMGHRTADASINPESVSAGTGFSLRIDSGDANADFVVWDTNGAIAATSVSSTTATLTGTASGWTSATIHIAEIPAKMDTLTDALDSFGSTLWAKTEVSAGTDITFASGQMSVKLRNGYPVLATLADYDFKESAAFVKLVSHPGANANGSAQALLFVDTADGLNGYLFTVEGNPLTISAYTKVGTTTWSLYSTPITYSSTDHLWLRIRHSAGTIYWDTSPDGSTWTNRFSKAISAFAHNAMRARLQAGDWFDDTNTGSAVFDNFNQTGATNGTGNGVTFTVAADLIEGSASATRDGSGSGVTFTDAPSLIAGSASGTRDGSGAGVTFANAPSLIAGSADGVRSPVASGLGIVATTPQLIPGSAAGDRSPSVSGVLFTASPVLIPGSASATRDGSGSGVLFSDAPSLTPGTASGTRDGTGSGVTFTDAPSLTPGSASGTRSGAGLGTTFTSAPSLIPGTASATRDGTASGVLFTDAPVLIPGTGSAGASGTGSGVTLTAAPSLIAGSASGTRDGTGSGTSFADAPVLIAGSASATRDGAASGVSFAIAGATVFFGSASGQDTSGGGSDPVYGLGGASVNDDQIPDHVAYEDGGVVRRTM